MLDNFHPAIKKWFKSQFSKPSPPQELGWPIIFEGKHALILAPTGSGKTLTAFLACIDDLFHALLAKRWPHRSVHTLYISPLKALNNDIQRNLQQPLRGIRQQAKVHNLDMPELRTMVRTGDTPANVRQSMLRNPPHILITTPESLYLLLTSERGREIFHNLRYLIIDEIHAICANKRGVHLSLSLERLMPLCSEEPVRIGLSATQRPLERIAAFLGGQKYNSSSDHFSPRPVEIVDCGERKYLDLRLIAPPGGYRDLEDASIWQPVIEQIYQLILQHETTLIFVLSRAQCERVARQINELHFKTAGVADQEIVRAHHGSLSRETRFSVELALKKGALSAVVATASLELGIDVGSIDLVIQLDAPTSIAGGLQRVGRSGHMLGATSKGRILPLYQAELPHAVAVAQSMLAGDIEETVIPERCLDVLSQQILAEVAVKDWSRPALFNLMRQSYCYRDLSPSSFDRVLEMLAGSYADTQIRSLKPRLSWDKVNDRLIARRGARMLATMNGGTIPDRGLYDVYLQDASVRVGQVDEEFVFERRVGETFYLGTSEWRIEAIAQDRIVVSPVRAIVPKPPFWKSDFGLPRDFITMQKVGAFLRELLEEERPQVFSQQFDYVAPEIFQTMQEYFDSQLDFCGEIATDRRIVVEQFFDAADQPMLLIHAPFGGRVNQAWAIGLSTFLSRKYHIEIQYSHDDDGLLLRLPDVDSPVAPQDFIAMPPDELENLVLAGLPNSPLFMVLFRYNAGSSLLLTRSRAGKRIPLWLQRLRTTDLLQNVRQFSDFPILLETYRDCLENVLDMRNLKVALGKIQSGEIEVAHVRTSGPSPMAAGLMYKFLERNLYELDRNRNAESAGEVARLALAEILSSGTVAAVITLELVEEFVRNIQYLAPAYRAKSAEDLFEIIDKLGPVDEIELQKRSQIEIAPALVTLAGDCRIQLTEKGWQSTAFMDKIQQMTVLEQQQFLISRVLQTNGPLTESAIGNKLPHLQPEQMTAALEKLTEARRAVHGVLVDGSKFSYWCDRHNFEILYRRAIAMRRSSAGITSIEKFYEFLLDWHGIGLQKDSIDSLIQRYRGFRFPVSAFEREILRSRLPEFSVAGFQKICDGFERQMQQGFTIMRLFRSGERGRRYCGFHHRGEGHLFYQKQDLLRKRSGFREITVALFNFLRENGASFADDILAGTGLSRSQLLEAFTELAENELLSCDQTTALQQLNNTNPEQVAGKKMDSPLFPEQAWRQRARGRRGRRAGLTQSKQKQQKLAGRWFLTTSFAAHGKDISVEKQAEKQARLLLQRYGVLVKEWYRRESGLLPWYQIFTALKRLEWQGEIRRGYFVHGLSGIQFALPEAVELLQKIDAGEGGRRTGALLLSTADPALPFGGMLQWNLHASNEVEFVVKRAFSNHLFFHAGRPIAYLESFAKRVYFLAGFEHSHVQLFADQIKIWLRLPASLRLIKNITIEEMDGVKSCEHKLAANLVQNGFEIQENALVLWPSAAG